MRINKQKGAESASDKSSLANAKTKEIGLETGIVSI
jgi:hypothetical protein